MLRNGGEFALEVDRQLPRLDVTGSTPVARSQRKRLPHRGW